MKLSTPTFDYSVLDQDSKAKLIWFAGEIRKQFESHVQAGLEIGRILSEAKEICKDDPFPKWVERECGFSVRTAYNYIAAYEHFGGCANFAQIELSAMYALTKNESAKKKAMNLASKGVLITHAKAKEIIDSVTHKATGQSGKSGVSGNGRRPETTQHSESGAETSGSSRSSEAEETGFDSQPSPEDLGKCPNCAGDTWIQDDDGMYCQKCNHPHGEPAGDVDDDQLKTQKQKTFKTAVALMQAFEDLQLLAAKPKNVHMDLVRQCQTLQKTAQEW